MIDYIKTAGKESFRVITHPTLISKGFLQIFRYAYRIIKYRSLSVNINTKDFWNKKLSKVGDYWREDHYHHILALLPKDTPFTLFDLGCAIGDGAELILNRFPKAKITGADISEIGIEKAKRKTKGVSYIVFDIYKDEIPETYDYITIIETLEHFDDPKPIVDKCLKHCKKALLISTPYSRKYQGKIEFVDEHRYAFNEETFKSYNSEVVKVTDFMKETSSRCIVYRIFP
jgi:2-polyprenyl-3-methyl-5-hydroxy-6-metoxy-1,4-benzoquinol methylase